MAKRTRGVKITDDSVAADSFLRAAIGPVVARGRAMNLRPLRDAFDAYMRGLAVGGGRRYGATNRNRDYRLLRMRYHLERKPKTTAADFAKMLWPSADGRREYRITLITAKRDLAQIRRSQ